MTDAKKTPSPGTGGKTRTATQQCTSSSEAKYRVTLDTRRERKDACVSAIYEAVEITDQHSLPQNDQDKEVLVRELLERLIIRFRGELRMNEGVRTKITDFVIEPEENVCTAIDRLNGIVQKLIT